VRAKGFVRLAREERRAWLEKASGHITLHPRAMDPGETELVLIGPGLDEAEIQRKVWACVAGGASQ
jgi:G3E family GTPase